jgi:hypothetical protein
MPETVSDWSASREVALTVGAAGAVSVELTPTGGDAKDVALSVTEAESVTLSSNR